MTEENKQCTHCNKVYPRTAEYFYRTKYTKDSLCGWCKKCSLEARRAYRQKNTNKVNESQLQSYYDNKDRRLQDMKKYRSENLERMQETYKEWEQNNKDKLKEYNKNRLHKNHRISDKEWIACKQYFNLECAYCGMTEEEHKQISNNHQLHREHAIFNGANDLSNCVPSCRSCNSEKHTTDWNIWYDKNNLKFDQNRYEKILKWLNEDHKQHMKIRKQKNI